MNRMYEIKDLVKYISDGDDDTRVAIICGKEQLADLVAILRAHGICWCGDITPTKEDIAYYKNRMEVGVVLTSDSAYYFIESRFIANKKDLQITFNDLALAKDSINIELSDVFRLIGATANE